MVFAISAGSGCGGDSGEAPTDPVPTGPLSLSVSSIEFNYFDDADGFTVRNTGDSPFSWTASASDPWVEMDVTSGDLAGGATVDVSMTVVRDGLDTGAYTATVTVQTDASDSRAIRVSLNNYDEDISPLGFVVADAEYDLDNDVWVAVSQNPSQLHVIDPVNKTYDSVSLSATPQCVSVGPGGAHAVVGHNGWITRVNLTTLRAESPVAVTADAHDIVLTPDDWAIVIPRGFGWDNIRSVRLPGGQESQDPFWDVHGDAIAKLHPSGDYIYAADNHVSPSDFDKYDITSGAAVHMYDSPYHGDYAFSGNLWISDDGTKIVAASGNVFHATDDQQTDLTYVGSLSDVSNVTSAHFSDVTDKVYVCYATDTGAVTNMIRVYDGEFLQYQTTYTLPSFLVPNNSGGMFYLGRADYCSANSAGTALHVLARRADADMWAAVSFDLTP